MKQTIKLTEAELHQIITESVQYILNEEMEEGWKAAIAKGLWNAGKNGVKNLFTKGANNVAKKGAQQAAKKGAQQAAQKSPSQFTRYLQSLGRGGKQTLKGDYYGAVGSRIRGKSLPSKLAGYTMEGVPAVAVAGGSYALGNLNGKQNGYNNGMQDGMDYYNQPNGQFDGQNPNGQPNGQNQGAPWVTNNGQPNGQYQYNPNQQNMGGQPTANNWRQAEAEINKVVKGNFSNWPQQCRQAGWPEEKIAAYQKLANDPSQNAAGINAMRNFRQQQQQQVQEAVNKVINKLLK